MKTGFINAYCHKPAKKYYSYHGVIRDCLIEPDPDPFEEEPILPPYGPTVHMDFYTVVRLGWYQRGPNYIDISNAPVARGYQYGVGQRYHAYSGNYYIYRQTLGFDTAGLPGNAHIVSGYVHMVTAADSSITDFDIVIRSGGSICPHIPGEPGDYNKACYSGDGGSVNTASEEWGIIPLNSDGFAMVNRFGITRLALMSNRDMSMCEPSGQERVDFNPLYDLTILRIYYKLPL